jgi:hypothetical protein
MQVVAEDNSDWTRNVGGGFGTFTAADDIVHGRNGVAGDSLTETWFWAFHVPQANVNCLAYCWLHPNLDVVSSGLMIYKGIKRHHLASELFDWYAYLDAKVIGDGSDIRIPNGFRARALEKMRRWELSFEDTSRDTSFRVEMAALADPIVRANNKHFEQAMRVTGDLVLRGERWPVDCVAIRDRSWGELRPEAHNRLPPYTWVTGAFGDDFAFNVGAHDDPARNPPWLTDYHVEAERVVKDGWVWREGRVLRLKHASMISERDPEMLYPTSHEVDMTDTEGTRYRLTGSIVASAPLSAFPNVVCQFALARWQMADRVGWGESQEVKWNDYLWRYSPKLLTR